MKPRFETRFRDTGRCYVCRRWMPKRDQRLAHALCRKWEASGIPRAEIRRLLAERPRETLA